MRFVTIKENEVPRGKRMYKLEGELKEFMAMNVKYVKVQFTNIEYKSALTCYSSLAKAIKRYSLPIRAFTYKGKLYLERTDMD